MMDISKKVSILDINYNSGPLPSRQQHKSINELPDEMLLKIFSYFGPQDLSLNLGGVCYRWYCLCFDITLWRTFTVNIDRHTKMSVMVKILGGARALNKLVIRGRNDVDAVIKLLYESCEDLRKLVIKFCRLGRKSSSIFYQIHQHFPSLEKLRLGGSDETIDDDTFLQIAGFKELKSLNLSYSKGLEGRTLRSIVHSCKCLTELKLDDVVKICDDDIKYVIGELKGQLTVLVLDGEDLTDAAYLELGNCTKLRALEISFCIEMTDRALLEGVGALPNLQLLRLKRAIAISKWGITVYLKEKPVSGLTNLNLSELTALDDDGMILIALRCPLLRFLHLQWCWNITDVGVDFILENSTLLVTFDLLGVPEITGINFPGINISNLRKLNLQNCNSISDEILDKLIEINPQLDLIDYYGNNIRDRGRST